MMNSISTTEILPWLQHAAVVKGGKNGAGALHTRIRPVSVGQQATATRIGVTKAGANKVPSSLFIEAVMLVMQINYCAKRHHYHSG
jgi:hypothetical protein